MYVIGHSILAQKLMKFQNYTLVIYPLVIRRYRYKGIKGSASAGHMWTVFSS
jgi:hypothetical protein